MESFDKLFVLISSRLGELLSLFSLDPDFLLEILDCLVTVVLNLPGSLDFSILGLSQLLIVLLCIDQHLLQVVQLRIQLLHLRVVRDRHGAYLPNWLVFLLDHGVHVG